MPNVSNPKLYTATNIAAKDVFKQLANTPFLKKYFRLLEKGTPLYRFVGYRSFLPQQDGSVRTIWPKLSQDLNNRWTGLGVDGNGFQGLYLSMEAAGKLNTSFPEVEHYQDSNLPPTQEISYFNYEPNKAPVWMKVQAGELRSVFLFTLTQSLLGFNLQFEDTPDSLLNRILETAKRWDPSAFSTGVDVKSLYFHPDDASFNRAIGNAGFEFFPECSFINTLSVRDGKSINLVMKGSQGIPNQNLKAEGRNTFYIDSVSKTTKAVYTMDDLLYNNLFDETGLNLVASKKDLLQDLSKFIDAAKNIHADIDWSFAQNNIDSTISKNVGNDISKMTNPFEQEINTLINTVRTEELIKTLKDVLSNYVNASAQTSAGYLSLYNQIGLEGIQSLLNSQIVEPKFTNMTADTDHLDSYLSVTIRDILLERKTHWLNQKAAEIQQSIAQKASHIQQTSNEISAAQNELTSIQQELKGQPDDQALQERANHLQTAINQLVNEQKQAEADEANLGNQDKTNAEDAKGTKADKERTEAEKKKRSSKIFGE